MNATINNSNIQISHTKNPFTLKIIQTQPLSSTRFFAYVGKNVHQSSTHKTLYLHTTGTHTSVFSPDQTSRNSNNSDICNNIMSMCLQTSAQGLCCTCTDCLCEHDDYDHLPSRDQSTTQMVSAPTVANFKKWWMIPLSYLSTEHALLYNRLTRKMISSSKVSLCSM